MIRDEINFQAQVTTCGRRASDGAISDGTIIKETLCRNTEWFKVSPDYGYLGDNLASSVTNTMESAHLTLPTATTDRLIFDCHVSIGGERIIRIANNYDRETFCQTISLYDIPQENGPLVKLLAAEGVELISMARKALEQDQSINASPENKDGNI
ncbi:MAG TPA: hypothetical protein VGM77_11240 [Gemmatimonadales bacterium]|jgi:hypothetical protein